MPSLSQGVRLRGASAIVLAAALLPLLAACGGNLGATVKRSAFTSSEYGVSVSPRVTWNSHPRHGGGRYLVGNPYTVHGVTYVPADQPDYVATGVASWYGSDFHGRVTANGEIFSANAITGAHPTLPLPCYVRVTNLSNGRSILVRINDRGPYMPGRIIDLSYKTADILGLIGHGTGEVQVRYVAPAPLNGDDTRMLTASLNRWTQLEEGETRLAYAPAPTPQQPSTQTATAQAPVPIDAGLRGRYSAEDLAQDFAGLFSYANAAGQGTTIADAADAANAMAGRSAGLADWLSVDGDAAASVKLQLGIFLDPDGAEQIAERFAFLGAVDQDEVASEGRAATRLTLTHLKPGVARTDVLALARELGLNSLVLY